ncbi:MAG: hypothetical protein JSW15_01645 [Deltaproteobacteria bacterium]|nr:MAG: hypothetical protein JSW15_01645 [Deltaproteobacteria bacterium]
MKRVIVDRSQDKMEVLAINCNPFFNEKLDFGKEHSILSIQLSRAVIKETGNMCPLSSELKLPAV